MFLFSLLVVVASWAQQTNITCDYQIVGVPFSQVTLGFLENGQPEDFVTITVQGRSHRESYTPVAPGAGEKIHGWISQESSENSIEMVVFQEKQSAGDSKLVNHRVPFGKEIWGNCVSSSSERP